MRFSKWIGICLSIPLGAAAQVTDTGSTSDENKAVQLKGVNVTRKQDQTFPGGQVFKQSNAGLLGEAHLSIYIDIFNSIHRKEHFE